MWQLLQNLRKISRNCRTNFRATRPDLLDSCIPILPATYIAKYGPNRSWTGLHFNAALVSPDFLFTNVHEKRIPNRSTGVKGKHRSDLSLSSSPAARQADHSSGDTSKKEIYARLERRKRLQDTESKKFTQEDKVHSTICRQKFTASQETAGPY
jgi:hypothetical protein